MMATSGLVSTALLIGLLSVLRLGHDFPPGMGFEDRAQPGTNHLMIIRDQNARHDELRALMAIYIETRERTKTPDAFEGYETPKTSGKTLILPGS